MGINKKLADTMREVISQLRDVNYNACSHDHCSVCEKLRTEVMRDVVRAFGFVLEPDEEGTTSWTQEESLSLTALSPEMKRRYKRGY